MRDTKTAGFNGKKITVVGLARSGAAAANLLHGLGASVTVTDSKDAGALAVFSERLSPGIITVFGPHPDGLFTAADMVVISPGVPLTAPPLVRAREAGVPVIGELELAYRVSDSPFIAITGTNGKSTTTTLVGSMLAEAGMDVLVGGNLGNALTEEPAGLTGKDFVVAEVSSFQLEAIDMFCPKIAAVLNITQDHLDRYDGMDGYARAKAEVFRNQTEGDVLVLNADDAPTMALASRARSRILTFSRKAEVRDGVCLRDGDVVSSVGGVAEKIIAASEIRIKGAHNLENAMAAAAISLAAGASAGAVAATLRSFSGLEHRMEFVRELDGVTYINDSKGTNVGAVEKSLEGFDSPVVLIAGGLDKHSDFSPLGPLMKEKVKKLVLIGKAAGVMEEALGGFVDTVKAGSLEEAVIAAKAAAGPGDVVLLSPACASFDMFKDFEDRGRQFKEIVNKL